MKLKHNILFFAGFLLATLCIAQNSVTIGSEELNAKAVLRLVTPGGNQGFILPVVDDKNSVNPGPSENGMLVYESSTSAVFLWNGSEWVNITEGGNLAIAQLNEIGDVSANTPTEGQVLQYQTGVGWVANDIALEDMDDQVAAEVAYDNATSGLTATDVQAALDELSSGSANSPWSVIDSNILYDKGNVEIGPGSLSIASDSDEAVSLRVENSHSDGLGAIGVISSLDATSDITKTAYSASINNGTGKKTGFLAVLDHNGTSTAYGFRGIMDNVGSGDTYGIHLAGEEKNYLSGHLGVGIDPTSAKVHVKLSPDDDLYRGIHLEAEHDDGGGIVGITSDITGDGTGLKYGFSTSISGGTGDKYGISLGITQNSTDRMYGVFLSSRNNGSEQSRGLYYRQTGSGTGTNYGLYLQDEDRNYFSGKVGIGTSSPSGKAEIFHNSTISGPHLQLREDGNDFARLTFSNSNSNFWTIAALNTTSRATERLNFYNNASGDLMSLTGDGNLGIGFTSPTERLEVNGQIRSYGLFLRRGGTTTDWRLVTGSGNDLFLLFDGTAVGQFDFSSGAYTTLSDRNRKTDIQPLEPVLEDVLRLQASQYHFIHNATEKPSIGFIAQEVDNLFPELVHSITDENQQELLTLDYSGFGVLAIKAIQEQQQIIEHQESRIKALEDQVGLLIKQLQKKP